MIDPKNAQCMEFDDQAIADAAAAILDEATASRLFDHIPHCRACQERMHKTMAGNSFDPLPERPGVDENPESIRSFLSRVLITPPAIAEFSPGDHIDRYEVINRIGKGGSSFVYVCFDPQLHRQVALKILTEAFYIKKLRARHELEAKSLARLDHPWIVKAYEINPFHFPPYIVLEYVAGGSSSKLVQSSTLAPRSAARLVAGVARAVQHAHDHGILHRDLKPSNLLVAGPYDPLKGVTPQTTLKVSDFGLARLLSEHTGLTSTDNIIGTPAYMSPEQASGATNEIGPASDVYSLGVVLYEYLIGRPPLVAENAVATILMIKAIEPVGPLQIRPGIPRDIDTICLKCLRKDPAERYATARELAEDLERYLEGRPIHARPIGPLNRLYRWARRKPGLAAAIVSSMVLLSALAAVSVRFAFVQAKLIDQAENNARLFRDAARKASEESDFSRNLFIASLRNTDGLLKQIRNAKSPQDLSGIPDQVTAINKAVIAEYVKRSRMEENLRGDALEAYFRDAIAFRELGYPEACLDIMNRLIEHNHALPPADPDKKIALTVAIKAVTIQAVELRASRRNDQALTLIQDFIRKSRFNFDAIHEPYEAVITHKSLIDTYIDTLRDAGMMAEAESLMSQRSLIVDRVLRLEKAMKPPPFANEPNTNH